VLRLVAQVWPASFDNTGCDFLSHERNDQKTQPDAFRNLSQYASRMMWPLPFEYMCLTKILCRMHLVATKTHNVAIAISRFMLIKASWDH